MEQLIKVYISAIPLDFDFPKDRFNQLLEHTSTEKKEKILKFKFFKDALRGLAADLLIRHIIVNCLGLENQKIQFAKNEFGKPFLINQPDFHFNLSHAGKWVVCAVHNQPVGIDIEQIAHIDINIAERFFSENEYKYLLTKKDTERLSYFYDFWTLKESYIKAAGKGLSIPLDSFWFKLGNDKIHFETKNTFKDCYFKQYNIDADYKLSLCAKVNNFDTDVDIMDISDLSF